MKNMSRRISELIEHIYAASIDAELWPKVLERVSDVFAGHQATFYSHDIHRGSADVQAHWGLESSFLNSYTEYFAPLNPFVGAVSRLKVGASATATDLIDLDIYGRSEFFNDWVRPQGCGEFMTTKLSLDVSHLSGVTVLRGARAFSMREKAMWSGLSSHLHRAMQVHRELCTVRFARDGAVEALNGLSVGVVLAGVGGTVLFANAVGERALKGGFGIRVSGGRLSGEMAGAGEALSQMIDAAINGSGTGGVLAMPSQAGDPVPVLVSPLPGGRAPLDVAGRAAALVMIGGGRKVRVDRSDLMHAFGLTQAEARLLVALVEGGSLNSYASDNAIALETVRAHLRKVLAKTGSARQADAIRRVMSDVVLARSD